MNLLKNLYFLRRYLASFFTYRCVSCGKNVRGNCLCKNCTEKLSPAVIPPENLSCAYYYDGPAKETVVCYKFGENYDFCRDTLCDWLLSAFKKFSGEKIDIAVCVPSFKNENSRLAELSKEFCSFAEIPFEPSVLKKIRETEKQHKLSYDERRLNLVGAFKAESSVSGKTVLLIDDIYTTGSTALECSNTLYEKGAEKVLVLTVLKTKLS